MQGRGYSLPKKVSLEHVYSRVLDKELRKKAEFDLFHVRIGRIISGAPEREQKVAYCMEETMDLKSGIGKPLAVGPPDVDAGRA